MDHLRQAPCAEARHQNRRDERHRCVRLKRQHFVRRHVVRHIRKTRREAADLRGQDDEHDQRRNADHHNKALHEIRLQRRHIAAENQNDGRGDRDYNHADLLVHAENHGAHARQPLIDRGGVRDQKHEDDDAREKTHARAFEAHFKELRHRLDLPAPREHARPFREHKPSEQRAEHRVAHADEHAPQAEAPPGAARIADEHDRGKIRGAVAERGDPRPCAAPADRERLHAARVFPRLQNTDCKHHHRIHADHAPDHCQLIHFPYPFRTFSFTALALILDKVIPIIPHSGRKIKCKRRLHEVFMNIRMNSCFFPASRAILRCMRARAYTGRRRT